MTPLSDRKRRIAIAHKRYNAVGPILPVHTNKARRSARSIAEYNMKKGRTVSGYTDDFVRLVLIIVPERLDN